MTPPDRVRRELFATGTPWEPIVGYSRAVRVGDQIFVSGTTGTGPNGRLVAGGAGPQTRQVLANIKAAIERAGGTMADVVRTRMFVTDIAKDWETIGRIHGEIFKDIRPVTSMVEVKALIDPEMVVEIEADAVIG